MKHSLIEQMSLIKSLLREKDFQAKKNSNASPKGWKPRQLKLLKEVAILNDVYSTLASVNLVKHLPRDQRENSGVKINN